MNKVKSIILILMLSISYSYGQETIDVEIFGAPVYSYRLYKSQNFIDPQLNYPVKGADYFDNEFKNRVDNLEKPIVGYSFGFKATYNLTKQVAIQSGLKFLSIGEKADYGYVAESVFVEILGVQVPMFSTEKYKLIMKYNYRYISIPLIFRYKFLDFDKIEIIPTFGLDFDFLINKKVENSSENKVIKYASKFDSTDHSYNKLTSAMNLGLEFNYSLTDKIQIYVLPNFEQFFTPNERLNAKYHIGGDSYILDKINKYNYLVGLNCGLRLKNLMNK